MIGAVAVVGCRDPAGTLPVISVHVCPVKSSLSDLCHACSLTSGSIFPLSPKLYVQFMSHGHLHRPPAAEGQGNRWAP